MSKDTMAITVWKNGEWHVWHLWDGVDAIMASEDPNYLMTISGQELREAIEAEEKAESKGG